MQKAIILLLLFEICLVYSCECHGRGVCTSENESVCECRPLWSGDTCEDVWMDNQMFYGLFVFYVVFEVVIQFICLVYASYQLYVIFRFSPQSRWSVPTYILLLCVSAAILRIIGFSVDPHGFKQEIPLAASNLMFDLPLVLWLVGGFMLYLFWIEMQSTVSNQQLLFVQRFKPILIVFAIICTASVIGIDFWQSIYGSALAGILYNALFAIMFLGLIGMISFSGYKMTKTLKSLWEHTKHTAHLIFLRKLTNYMLFMDGCLIASVICLIAYLIADAGNKPGAYLIFHTFFRAEEFGIVIQTLNFLSRKKPVKSPSEKSTEFTGPSASTNEII